AVPEPSSLALFGIGACIAGFGAARRLRREKQQEATA
ncbi:MAG: PEP-CTERM sorting domain-containing protein, partial [Planctomyces sp.]